MKKLLILILLLPLLLNAAKYYIAPTGSDGNAGTLAAPRLHIDAAIGLLSAGDTLYCRGGNYDYIQQVITSVVGNSTHYFKIWNFPNETPVFDYTNYIRTGARSCIYFNGCSYIWLKGLRFTALYQQSGGMAHSGVTLQTGSSNNKIEQIVVDHIGGHGYFIGDDCKLNHFINCDVHDIGDPYTDPPYDGSNGFSINAASADSNYFFGCRAWFCSDDGWDFFGANGYSELDNCWAMYNGYYLGQLTIGNGVGFKVGPNTDASNSTILRKLTRCVAAGNNTTGFDQNRGSYARPLIVYNCTAYKNNLGIGMGGFNVADSIINTISYGNTADKYISSNPSLIQNHNSWSAGITTTSDDFVSVDSTQFVRTRKTDGSLPTITFLHLKSGSDLIDAGTDVGLSYNGTYPDLGAFEYVAGVVIDPPAPKGTTVKVSGKVIKQNQIIRR